MGEQDDEFEEHVRTVARALWPQAREDGAANVSGAQHDGIYFTHDVVHCVEATVSRRRDKAEHDGEKLSRAIKKWAGTDGRLARGWFVTLNDPTPEQTKALSKIDRLITPISFKRFKARILDFYSYYDRRMRVRFGSARNPEDDVDELEPYVPVDFLEREGDGRFPSTLAIDGLVKRVLGGERFALLGDYGIGKSMNLRELFLRLARAARDGEQLNYAVHLNLKDHWGQRSPRVALTQHAEDLGYDRPDQLVSAWRAGYVHVLLDGFDELAAPGWSGDVEQLVDSRFRAVELIRSFYDQTPKSSSVVVAGRSYYFDSIDEMRESMFSRSASTLLDLRDFDEDQVRKYLQSRRWHTLPKWLPTRPLLIGYLAARGVFSDSMEEALDLAPAVGWDWLLNKISEREARIEAGLNGRAVREIVERLASVARKGSSGLGPLTHRDIAEGFAHVRGQEPSDVEWSILERLPGLAVEPDSEKGTRSFIDVDFANAAQARALSQFLIDPFSTDLSPAKYWAGALDRIGIEVAVEQCDEGLNAGRLRTALSSAGRNDLDVLMADVARVGMALNLAIDEASHQIHSVHVPTLDLFEDQPSTASLTFTECLFGELSLSGEIEPENMPRFESCHFDVVIGRIGVEDLPSTRFGSGCSFGDFPDKLERNADIIDSALPRGVRVLLTILRKLYLQRGRGRAESALVRGMPQGDRELVPPCLALLAREGMAVRIRIKSRPVWLPDRSNFKRVSTFVAAPRGSVDPLFGQASKL